MFTRAPARRRLIVATAAVAGLALLVGSEGLGLSDGAIALADHRVCIPIRDAVDSLNLSVAVGIALHRLSSAG